MSTPTLAERLLCHDAPPVSDVALARSSAAWVQRGGMPFEEVNRAIGRIGTSRSATPRRLLSWFLHPDGRVAVAAARHTPLWDQGGRVHDQMYYAFHVRVMREHAAGIWWSPLQDAGPTRWHRAGDGARAFAVLPECAGQLPDHEHLPDFGDHLTNWVTPILSTEITSPEALAPLLDYLHHDFRTAVAQNTGGWTPEAVRQFVAATPELADLLATNPTLDAACCTALSVWALSYLVPPTVTPRPAHWPTQRYNPDDRQVFSNVTDTLVALVLPREEDTDRDESTPLDLEHGVAPVPAPVREYDAEHEREEDTTAPPARVHPARVVLDDITWAALTAALPREPAAPFASSQIRGTEAARTASQHRQVATTLQQLWPALPAATQEHLIRTRPVNDYALAAIARMGAHDPVMARAVLSRGSIEGIRAEVAAHAAAVADDAVWAILRTSRSGRVHETVLAVTDRADRRIEALEILVRGHPRNALTALLAMEPSVRATIPASSLLAAFVTAPLELRLEALTLLQDLGPSAAVAPPRGRRSRVPA